MKDFLNSLLYEKKKVLFPVITISFLIGIICGVFFIHLDFSLGCFIVLLSMINMAMLLGITYYKTYDEIRRDKILKAVYFSLNFICFEVFLYLDYDNIYKLFRNIKISYMPTEIYIVILLTGIFLLSSWLLFVIMFSSIKMTKITTSGVEVEVDDAPITEKQNQILNSIQGSIGSVMRTNGEMDRIVAEFISRKLLDENGEVLDSYNFRDLFDCLRNFSNDMFPKKNFSVTVDYKSINNLAQIKEDYNIPNNTYNKIASRINSLPEGKNDVFPERNLVFINYRFLSIDHPELKDNRIIGIIEFNDIKEGFSDYGSLLIISIKMFDYICALTLSSLDIGGNNNEG